MFKRLLVLAVALALFVAAFFIYFHISDAQIDTQFRQEREKFHVADVALTAPDSSALPGNNTQSAEPASPASQNSAPAGDSNLPPVSPNALIGPVPPAAPAGSSAPAASDGSTPPAGTNAAPDNSSYPATPAPVAPSSTFLYPRLGRLPFVLLAAYETQGQAPDSASSATGKMTTPAVDTPTNSAASSGIKGTAETPSPTPSVQSQAQPSTNRSTAETTPAPQTGATVPPHSPVPVAASVIVLGYHQFTGPGIPSKNIYSMRQDVFDQEMKFLKDNNYHVVPLADVVRFVEHKIGLPPNSVAVTIDDGYKSAIVWAAPVLKKYGFPWTFFVYPDFITVAEGKGAASWNDLLQLQSDGVDIECHSKSHPIMTKKGAKTPEQYDAWLTAETAGAKATLEQHLGKPVRFFAYPYGAYNKEVEAKVVQAGFEAVFTVANNPVHPSTNVDAVGRYIITTPVEKMFASYLHEGALGVAEATPAPGATISDPRPVITAVLGYAGTLDPNSISAEVRDFGEVRHDYDPATSTVRLYLPRDLIQSVVIINIHAKDATSGQKMVASWRFNYAPAAPGAAHPPIPATVHASMPAPSAVPTAAVAPATPGASVSGPAAAVTAPSLTTDPTTTDGTNSPSLSGPAVK